jgi:hypothetical protein
MHLKVRPVSLSALVVAALVVAVGSSFAQSGDPLHGTWKLDIAKSTFSPGPAPKATNLKYEPAGDRLRVIVDVENEKGKAHWEYTAGFDGKEQAVTGNPEVDLVSLKRIGPATTEASFKKSGKPTTTNTRVVSPDGKTLTITIKGTNAQGQAVHNVQVYDKQ